MAKEYGISGVVDKVFTKVKSTRAGDKTIHYAEVDGISISTGFSQPFSEGEMIDIGVNWNYGEYNYQKGTTSAGRDPAPKGGGASSGPVASKKFGGGGYQAKSNFPIDPKDGQMSIIRQNSMNRAVEILDTWISNGIWKPNKEDEYITKLHEVALTITDFNSGQDIMKMMAAKDQIKAVSNG